MARELVSLTIRNEDLLESVKELDEYKLQYKVFISCFACMLNNNIPSSNLCHQLVVSSYE